MSITIQEAIKRITDHMEVHHIGEPPHIKIGDALLMAIEALRDKAEREDPKPLTLEELRKMENEPVWLYIQKPRPWQEMVMLVQVGEVRITRYCTFWLFGDECELDFNPDEYGKTWTVYRHKPKEV